MCFCSIRPVECAKALGGVEIGKHIANEAAIATPTSKVREPPIVANSGEASATTARIGMSNAAVAVLLIKFEPHLSKHFH